MQQINLSIPWPKQTGIVPSLQSQIFPIEEIKAGVWFVIQPVYWDIVIVVDMYVGNSSIKSSSQLLPAVYDFRYKHLITNPHNI